MKESPEYIDELIERYLQMQMDASERQAFERLLEDDTDLQERFDHHSRLMQLTEQEEGVAELSNNIYEIFEEQESKSTRRLYLQAAAFFLAAIGLVFTLKFFNSEKTPEELAVAYFEPFSDVVTSRAGTDSLVAVAMTAYNREDYPNAITYFNQLDQPENSVFALYLGISYFSIQDYQKAMNVLDRLERNAPSNLTHTSKWYAALTALALNHEDDARVRLQELSKTNSSITEKARQLLLEIK